MTAELAGRRVLITGGATGIGAAASHALLDAGAAIAVVQRTQSELASALESTGLAGRVAGLSADLGVPGEPERAVRWATRTLGGLDGFVANAAVTGPPAHRTLLDIDHEYVDRMLAVNLRAPITATAEAARHFAAHGGGTVVLVSSVLAHAPAPAASVYSATKAGLIAFARGAALELGALGVRVVTVSPGDIATPSSVAPDAPDGRRAVREPAVGRRGEPAEIGSAVRFLLGPGGSYVTGTDLLVDGGFLLS
ncbi:SDR family NAD(P)-dependent oxidoreductase [Agromyces silvae]|uniref:SDR family NAD(P)-dependent oxidoreductase n=1 Tax=Agromyces silvae TaxID=3388266 RepID=UPI00280B45D5|nr:SDR family oxidoreductase [Agromyces protaetiae]